MLQPALNQVKLSRLAPVVQFPYSASLQRLITFTGLCSALGPKYAVYVLFLRNYHAFSFAKIIFSNLWKHGSLKYMTIDLFWHCHHDYITTKSLLHHHYITTSPTTTSPSLLHHCYITTIYIITTTSLLITTTSLLHQYYITTTTRATTRTHNPQPTAQNPQPTTQPTTTTTTTTK